MLYLKRLVPGGEDKMMRQNMMMHSQRNVQEMKVRLAFFQVQLL